MDSVSCFVFQEIHSFIYENNCMYIISSAWLWAGQPGLNPRCRRGGDFSSLLLVQTDSGVHLTSCKMSAGDESS